MLFALIIGLTNMIPYFGPFIGAIPVTALTMLDSPIKGVWVLIFIIILQQFDGIILGPKILGSSTGLKPIGVIFAIIVGGAIAGPLGMFFGVPIFSVALTALMNFIDKNYNEKTAHLSPIVETEAENENTKASE
jgi:predicted PurR-regulated permease PerM